MSKKNIPGYHITKCCRICKYRSKRKYVFNEDFEWQEVCIKYKHDIQDYGVCNSFEDIEVIDYE